jgi:hypothetical protein
VDDASGEWLADQVRRAGLTPALEPFTLRRVDLVENALIVGGRRIDGIPLFDGVFTDAPGIRGKFGKLVSGGSDADIALTETAVNASGAGALGDARRSNRYKAIIAITRGRRPGLCPSNADAFQEPFGPPALQVSSEDGPWLSEQAARGASVQVIARVARTEATARNVVTEIRGVDSGLAPIVVMTPRSGWYTCASERGGGIAAWLEVMRAFKTRAPRRTIIFVASSGHELGHLGINAFIDARPGIVTRAAMWLHLGANIGAAVEASNTLQASDDEIDARLTAAMKEVGLAVARRSPRGAVPGGEAEAVHRGKGRYVSIIGGNGLFHNPADRGPDAIDPTAIATFALAFVELLAREA